jgi:hypothetical protein
VRAWPVFPLSSGFFFYGFDHLWQRKCLQSNCPCDNASVSWVTALVDVIHIMSFGLVSGRR